MGGGGGGGGGQGQKVLIKTLNVYKYNFGGCPLNTYRFHCN